MWSEQDKIFMHRAWTLALRGKGKVSPNPMVGAVVVKNGKIVGEGWHKQFGGPHAEVFTLQQAGSRAQDAKLYVTLEPCRHFGQTPPCVDKIIQSGIKEVIVGMRDPNSLMKGKSLKKLQQAGLKVRQGLFANGLQQMNEAFVKYITQKRPFVVAKIAQTLDGKTATSTGESKWITDTKTREFSRRLRHDFDAILVGINTVLQDNPRLDAPQKKLKKIILDSTLKISPRAQLFKSGTKHCFVATTSRSVLNKRKLLESKGITVIVCPAKKGRVDLRFLMKELARHKIASVLIEGGSRTVGQALKEKIIDKLQIFLAPRILGDQEALSSIRDLNIRRLSQTISLKNIRVAVLEKDILVEGYV